MDAFQANPFALLALFSGGVCLELARATWGRRRAPGARAFAGLTLATGLYGLTNALELSLTRLADIRLILDLEYIPIVLIPVLWVALVLALTEHTPWLNRITWPALLAIPALTLALVYTNDGHHWYYTALGVQRVAGYVFIDIASGPWHWVITFFIQACLLGGAGLLAAEARRARGPRRRQLAWLVAGVLFPLGAHWLYLLYMVPVLHWSLDLAPLVLSATGLVYWRVVFRQGIFELAPLAREWVVEELPQAMLTLDPAGRPINSTSSNASSAPPTPSRMRSRALGSACIWSKPLWSRPAAA